MKKCCRISSNELEHYVNYGNNWVCQRCTLSEFPFSQLDENDWALFNLDNKNLVSNDVRLFCNPEKNKFINDCRSVNEFQTIWMKKMNMSQ